LTSIETDDFSGGDDEVEQMDEYGIGFEGKERKWRSRLQMSEAAKGAGG
jgi:hypothetical protein